LEQFYLFINANEAKLLLGTFSPLVQVSTAA